MSWKASLFDDETLTAGAVGAEGDYPDMMKEDSPVDRLKNLEEKIAMVVDRVKGLKEEKIVLERKIRELETLLDERNREVESMKIEKTSIKNQVEELLGELEALEI